jgi:hypothetical protein
MSSRNENTPDSRPQRTWKQYERVSLYHSNVKLFSGQRILTMKVTRFKLFMFRHLPNPTTFILFPVCQGTPTFLRQGKTS